MTRWLLYGAYGYTGRLLVDEALRRGHQPVLAGRSPSKVKHLAEQHGLDWLALDLADRTALERAAADFDLVLHAAGPFIHTGEAMVRACLAGKTHYLDITGEIPVFEKIYSYHDQARRQGVALIPGVGFDVVATDCLACYAAEKLPEADSLEIALVAKGGISAGTLKTVLEMLPKGGLVRRAGRLVPYPIGVGLKTVRFSNGKAHLVLPAPTADLTTSFRSTSIPNITAYLALPSAARSRLGIRLVQKALSLGPLRRLAQKVVEKTVQGPGEALHQTGKVFIWTRVADRQGRSFEACLETVEAYRFTALAGIRAVETTLQDRPAGALSPAQAFGADFVLEIEGTHRLE